MLPQQNAQLTKVVEGGTAVDWDQSDTAGPSKFTGKAPAYYREVKEKTTGGTGGPADLVTRRYLFVEPHMPDILWETDDVCTWTYKGREMTGTVATTDERDLPGQPVYGTVRIAFKVE